MLKRAAVADILQVSERQVDVLASRGDLLKVHVGKSARFPQSTVVSYISQATAAAATSQGGQS